MRRFVVLLRNKVFVITLIILLTLSSVGFVSAYRKFVQNSNSSNSDSVSNDNLGYGSDEERDFTVGKFFLNQPQGSTVDNRGILHAVRNSLINYQIWFKGKLDKNPAKGKADVILLIDRSMSMKSIVSADSLGDCQFRGRDPNGNINDPSQFNNSKLCYSIMAAEHFIALSADDKNEIRVGYVTYAAEQYTTDQIDPQHFRPLADMTNDAERTETRQWMRQIGFHENSVSGTAMGKATNIALDELQRNGRSGSDVQKYIIVLTDGVGNQNPLMTGCASWRKTPSDAWPTNYPNSYTPCQVCPWGYRAGSTTCNNPPDTYQPPYDLLHHPADLVDCCITSNAVEGYPPRTEIKVTDYSVSPVGRAAAGGILMPMIGFGTVSNMNRGLMAKIVEATYKDPQKAKDFTIIQQNPANIYSAFGSIFESIIDGAAPIHFEETLPAGVDVDIPSGITIERNIKDLDFCPGDSDYFCRRAYRINQGENARNNIQVSKELIGGRVVIKFDLDKSHYDGGIPFENQRFFVNFSVSTANALNSAFDLDQNQDIACGGNMPDSLVSWVEWHWNFRLANGQVHEPVKTQTPRLCVQLRPTQYTGDVYGVGINDYLFPGIDVLVSGVGITPSGGTQAVWELDNYDFSSTSFSDFLHYQNYFRNQINALIAKAAHVQSAAAALNSNKGGLFYVAGNQEINNQIILNNERRTLIVDGNLAINAPIIKADHQFTAVIIVLKDNSVSIGNVQRFEAGIVAPEGTILVEDRNSPLAILGFLVGRQVNLKSNFASTQSVNYDIDLAKFTPPGIGGLYLPLFQEVAP